MSTRYVRHTVFDAIHHLEYLREELSYNFECEHMVLFRLLIQKLRVLGTFLLCLEKIDWTKDSSERPKSVLLQQLKKITKKIDRGYFNFIYESLVDIESLEDELDQWYTTLSKYLLQASNSPVAREVEDIFNSVLENLEDFLSLHIAYVGAVIAPVEALRENITFWRYFLHFATYLGITRQQEFQDLLRNMEALAFSAAHFTLHLFSARHYNIKVFTEAERNLRANYPHHLTYASLSLEFNKGYLRIDALYGPHSHETSYERIKSTISTLLLGSNPRDNPHLYKSYTRALENMKSSRESYVPNHCFQESTLLPYILWNVLQFQTGPVVVLKDKLHEMYEGFRYLGVLLEKHPDEFDGEVWAITRSGIFDAGVIILSVYQNHDAVSLKVKELMGMMKVIRSKVEKQAVNTSRINFPKTTVLAFLDFLLNYLTEVESSNVDSVTPSCLREHLRFLRSCMEKLVKNQLEDLHQSVWNFAVEVSYKIEVLINQMVLGDIVDSDLMSLQSITEAMEIIKADCSMIFDNRREEIKVPREVSTLTSTEQVTPQSSIPSTAEFVGFEDERKSIIDRLTRGSKKLQVVAIVGMPGSGKTTLATNVYNEPSVQQHFHVRVWCSISQEFNKRKVLLELLSQIPGSKLGDDSDMTEDEVAQELRRSLLQRRYLIFIDDIWEDKAFESLKLSFPDDSFGRILLTSRIGEVAKLDDQPHLLRQLTFSESLELLQMKASPGKGWPQSLYHIAVKIAENCKGLPLIIIIVAGLLGSTIQEVWEEVLENLTSGIISSTDQCQRTIELSYKHLPEHLKPCLLSFGAFPEDEDISVKRLIWLWIAEGFVQKTDPSSLEEVAAGYLKDLIGRSLVMVSQKRNGGSIKTCRVHDLLLDFCLRKAIEENSLLLLNGREEMLHFEESRNLRRLCVHSKLGYFRKLMLFCPRLRSLSFFGGQSCGDVADISFIFRVFKLLRVLNMERVRVSSFEFPGEIGLLVRLRYLAITACFEISPSIGNLSNLETFIIDQVKATHITMPDTFWNLRKMRHLYLMHMRSQQKFHGIILSVDKVDNACEMLELDSLSGLHSKHWGMMERKLRKFPNIRRLKFWLCEFGNDQVSGSKVMSFSFLSRLESLTLSFDDNSAEFEFIFPESIKQLNMSRCGLPWERISAIAVLPHLEVLKLLDKCFVGGRWQVEEGEFSKLRFLKLEGLDMINWTGWDYQFPNLEKLVVERCDKLEEIPECLENIDTLEMIEVIKCSDRAKCLFETLADYLKDRGNSELQIHVQSTSEPGSADEEDDDSANEGDEDSAVDEDKDASNEKDEDSTDDEDA